MELKATGTELSDRVKELENEVEGLKLENGWLRNLVLERQGSEQKLRDEDAIRLGMTAIGT